MLRRSMAVGCLRVRAASLARCLTVNRGMSSYERRGEVSLGSPEVSMAGKSFSEVFRGWLVFKLLSYDSFVNNCLKIYQTTRRLMGRWLNEKLLRATVSGQFVGGLSEEDTIAIAQNLAKRNIGTMWQYCVEQDIGEVDTRKKATEQQEKLFSTVNERYLKSIEMSATYNSDHPTKFAAVKLTAIINPHLLRKLSNMLEASRRVFQAISPSSNHTLARDVTMALSKGLRYDLPPDISDTSHWDMVDWCQHFNLLPDTVSRIENLLRLEPSAKLVEDWKLSHREIDQLRRFFKRITDLGECARSHGVRVLVAAEQTYFQPAIAHFTHYHLIPTFNHHTPVIYSTLQTYLTSSYDDLIEALEVAKRSGVKYGLSVVRGAYIEEERKLAKTRGLPPPIHPDKTSTDRSYHKAMETVLKEVSQGTTAVIASSHNQSTIEFVVEKMAELELSGSDGTVVFGQMKGMADHLTYPLVRAGYLPNKVVMYGSMDDVISFLVRRAQENRGSNANARIERKIYAQEIKKRLLRRSQI